MPATDHRHSHPLTTRKPQRIVLASLAVLITGTSLLAPFFGKTESPRSTGSLVTHGSTGPSGTPFGDLAKREIPVSRSLDSRAALIVTSRPEQIQRAVAKAEADAAAKRASIKAAKIAAAKAAAARKAAAVKAAKAKAAKAAAEKAAAEKAALEAATSTDPGTLRDVARLTMLDYGFAADQWTYLDQLVARESGWNPTAQNPSSGAYGLPQALPGTKMASAGADWKTNAATQIKWMCGYIAARYGTPKDAWAHSQSAGWY